MRIRDEFKGHRFSSIVRGNAKEIKQNFLKSISVRTVLVTSLSF